MKKIERERGGGNESKPLGEHKKCRQLAGSKCSRCRRPGKKLKYILVGYIIKFL